MIYILALLLLLLSYDRSICFFFFVTSEKCDYFFIRYSGPVRVRCIVDTARTAKVLEFGISTSPSERDDGRWTVLLLAVLVTILSTFVDLKFLSYVLSAPHQMLIWFLRRKSSSLSPVVIMIVLSIP